MQSVFLIFIYLGKLTNSAGGGKGEIKIISLTGLQKISQSKITHVMNVYLFLHLTPKV